MLSLRRKVAPSFFVIRLTGVALSFIMFLGETKKIKKKNEKGKRELNSKVLHSNFNYNNKPSQPNKSHFLLRADKDNRLMSVECLLAALAGVFVGTGDGKCER